MKVILCCVVSVFVLTTAHAEVLRLKNGDTIEGQIIEEQDDLYLMLVDGFMATYYKDSVEEMAVSWADLKPREVNIEPIESMADSGVDVDIEMIDNDSYVSSDKALAQSPFQLTPTEIDVIKNMEKEELILKFMDVFGTQATLKASYEQMFDKMTPEQIEEVKDAVTVEDIIDQLLPLYSKYFTEGELRTYIAFYSSVEGRKLLKNIPLLMTDSIKTSMEYLQSRLPASVK